MVPANGHLNRSIALLALALLCSQGRTAEQSPPSSQGPVTRPMIIEIAKDTYFINEFGMDAIYFLVGQKRALAIDTGSGFWDLNEIFKTLTNLPYDVAITHGHPDHAGGTGQFDVVYIHPKDVEMANKISPEQRAQYGEIMRNMAIGYKNVWGYSAPDVRKWDKHPEIKTLFDGQVFDLGRRRITTYFTPGHSPGECVFLDDQSRILFSGDAANSNVSTGIAVSTAVRPLIRLQKLKPKYDRMYTGHISYAGTVNAVSQKVQVLDDVIQAIRSVLRGNAKTEAVRNHLFPDRMQTVAVFGVARVSFNPNRLWEEGEHHIAP